jgi:hypothetical protein
MAVNRSRSMTAELQLGLAENSYMRLDPNRGGVVEHSNVDRLSWPTYAQVERQRYTSKACGCPGTSYDEVSTRGTATTQSLASRRF